MEELRLVLDPIRKAKLLQTNVHDADGLGSRNSQIDILQPREGCSLGKDCVLLRLALLMEPKD